MKMDYSKFNQAFDMNELKSQIDEAKKNGGKKGDVPVNQHYDVRIDKLELTESKKGDPMVSVWFTILDGEFAKFKLFMNQVVNKGMGIHIMNEFLRSLKSGVEVEFENYQQYGEMLEDIFDIVNEKFEYSLFYGQKGEYNTFKIKEVYEVE